METETTITHADATRRGLPGVWERGGATTHHGSATVWAGPQGQPKAITYAPRGGHLSNGDHALFVARVGDFRITVSQQGKEADAIFVDRVEAIGAAADGKIPLTMRTVAAFGLGEWDCDPPACLADAIAACVRKACDYHCRDVFYGVRREGRP